MKRLIIKCIPNPKQKVATALSAYFYFISLKQQNNSKSDSEFTHLWLQKKLLKLTSVKRETRGSTSKPRWTMWKEGKGFVWFCCARIPMAAVKMKSPLPNESRGVCPRKSSSNKDQPLPISQWNTDWLLPLPRGRLLAFPLPRFKCSQFLTFIIVNDISWILYELPEVSSELMINHISLSCISASYPTIQDCSCQGSADSSCRMS